jgi:iron complex outermembrane receptor protein
LGVLDVVSVGMNNKARALYATSWLAFGVCFSHGVLAQSTTSSRGSAAATQLPPVLVQSPRAKRVKPAGSSRAGQSHVTAAHSRNAGRGNAAAAAAGASAGTQHRESAWGHVDGYVATRSASGTKTDTPLIETPAAISVVTQNQIQAQAAQSVAQAVRYTSGTRAEVTGADTRFDNVYVRGFLADVYLDGMKLFTSGFTQSIIEPFNLERIEVVHGPASVLYGQASPGGLLDLVSKRPTEDPYHEMFLSTGSYGRIQGGVDLSGPIDKDKQWLYRFTASGLDVGSQVDFTRYERVSIAPSLTWRPDTDTKITFLGTYQNDPQGGFYNQLPTAGYGTIFPLANGQHIPTSFYPGVPSQDQFSRELGQVGYLAEHRFDDVWTVRQNLRYTDTSTDVSTVYPLGKSPTDPNSLTRSAFDENDRLRAFTIDNQAQATFLTGPLSHTVLFGVDYQTGTFGYTAGGPPAGFVVPTISVTAPNYNTPVPMVASSLSNQNFDQVGLYTQDEIKFDHWVALLGVRWDDAESKTQGVTFASGTTTNTQLSNDAVTKRGALLYKFDNGIAPYIQYTESFQPQVGVAANNAPFEPTTGQQEEAGIKYQPNAKSLYTLAVFNLLQQNVLTPDLNNPGKSVQTGEIRSRGLELEGKTEIDQSLSLIGSYTYLDDVVTRSNVAFETGRRSIGMPMNSAALWADYTFHGGQLDGFGLAGGIRYLGDSPGNLAGPTVLDVPAVTLFDAAVHYDFSALGSQFKGYTLQVNATNLFDKTYVTLCQDNGCYYGLRRQVIATLRYRW